MRRHNDLFIFKESTIYCDSLPKHTTDEMKTNNSFTLHNTSLTDPLDVKHSSLVEKIDTLIRNLLKREVSRDLRVTHHIILVSNRMVEKVFIVQEIN